MKAVPAPCFGGGLCFPLAGLKYLRSYFAQLNPTAPLYLWEEHEDWGPNKARGVLYAIRRIQREAFGRENYALCPLNLPKYEPLVKRVLPPEEIEQVFRSFDMDKITYQRNLVMIRMSVVSGLQSSELVSVRFGNIDFENGVIKVRGKGGQVEYAPLDEETGYLCKALWRQLAPHRRPGVEELFMGVYGDTPGEGMTSHGWRKICRDVARQSGVPHFSPHALRRSFATISAKLGIDLKTLMTWGRWRKLDIALGYIQMREAESFNRHFSPALVLGNSGAGVAAPAPDNTEEAR